MIKSKGFGETKNEVFIWLLQLFSFISYSTLSFLNHQCMWIMGAVCTVTFPHTSHPKCLQSREKSSSSCEGLVSWLCPSRLSGVFLTPCQTFSKLSSIIPILGRPFQTHSFCDSLGWNNSHPWPLPSDFLLGHFIQKTWKINLSLSGKYALYQLIFPAILP